MVNINRNNFAVKTEKKFISLLRKEELGNILEKYNIKVLKDQDPLEKVTPFIKVLSEINFQTETKLNTWFFKHNYKGSSGVTKVIFHNNFDSEKPTFIFHHGIGESIHPLHLKALTNALFRNKFNTITIRACNHDSIKEVLTKYINDFHNLTSSMASSVTAIEKVIQFHKNLSNEKVIVAGVSLGGIIASLHYFSFQSSDLYFPIIAYSDFSKIFLHKSYKSIIKNFDLLKKNKSIINCFSTSSKHKKNNKDIIYPILGEYDTMVDYTDSIKFWESYNTTVFDVGHHSIFLKKKEIMNLIERKVKKA